MSSRIAPAWRKTISREMREKFFGTGRACRPHEPWEPIGADRQAKWLVLVDIAEDLIGPILLRKAAAGMRRKAK